MHLVCTLYTHTNIYTHTQATHNIHRHTQSYSPLSLSIYVVHTCTYSGTPLIGTPMGQKKVSFIEVSLFQGLKCMQEWYLGRQKVPFREVSSIQGCPYRGVPLYVCIYFSVILLIAFLHSLSHTHTPPVPPAISPISVANLICSGFPGYLTRM